jgi:uncharacterized protein YqfB (UPF0267 family)
MQVLVYQRMNKDNFLVQTEVKEIDALTLPAFLAFHAYQKENHTK